MSFDRVLDFFLRVRGFSVPRRISRFSTVEEAVHVLMVSRGLKPGALVMGASAYTVLLLEGFAESRGLYVEVREDGFGRGLFLTSDSDRFSLLGSGGEFYGGTDRSVGEFLGYDEDSIEYYVQALEDGRLPPEEVERKVEEMIDSGSLEASDARFLSLVGYLPVPDEEDVLEAVETGRDRYMDLEETEYVDLVDKLLAQSRWKT